MAKKNKLGWKLWAGIAAAAGAVWYMARPKPKKKNGNGAGNGAGAGNGTNGGSIPADAEYGPAHNPAHSSCSNCAYAPMARNAAARSPTPTVHCSLWNVQVEPAYICNRWKSREKPGAMA